MEMQKSNVVRVAEPSAVQAIAQNSDERYGIRVSDRWYNGKGKCEVVPGNVVEVAYVENGRFRNIQAIRMVSASPKLPGNVPNGFGSAERNRFVAYCVGLKAAATCLASPDQIHGDAIKRLAENFAEWLLAKASENAKAGEGKPPSPIKDENSKFEEVRSW